MADAYWRYGDSRQQAAAAAALPIPVAKRPRPEFGTKILIISISFLRLGTCFLLASDVSYEVRFFMKEIRLVFRIGHETGDGLLGILIPPLCWP